MEDDIEVFNVKKYLDMHRENEEEIERKRTRERGERREAVHTHKKHTNQAYAALVGDFFCRRLLLYGVFAFQDICSHN